jgi:hypothetical protein
VFCLNDGVMLRDAETEQETVSRPIVNFGKMPMLSPDIIVTCVSCQEPNRANSEFCKKCGTVLNKGYSQSGQSSSSFTPLHATPDGSSVFEVEPGNYASGMYEETVAFQPQRFTPPGHGLRTIPRPSRSSNSTAILIAILAAAIIGGGAIAYSLRKADRSVSSASNSASPKSDNTAVANERIVGANVAANSTYNSAIVGRTGRLSTNQRIRSASNRYSEILGVHYRGARVLILGVESYNTEYGYSTWYRVKVIENGCDQEGIRGCGNDLNEMLGQAAMEGWMNAKYIILD